MCEEGTIYLIQPELLINTNKFKIGMSKKNDLSRLKSYHSGTRFICIMCCENPLIIEKKIKDAFTLKYKLVAGNEYFEGNEEEILTDFFKIISENKTKTQIKKNDFIDLSDYDESDEVLLYLKPILLSNDFRDSRKFKIPEYIYLNKIQNCEKLINYLSKKNIKFIRDLINQEYNMIIVNEKETKCVSLTDKEKELEEDRLLVENEFIKNMNLGLENEKAHIWAFIHYKQKDYKFRCVKRLLKDGDKNLLFAKVLIKYFAKKNNISCDDGLEVLADLAEDVINKIYNY
jgi:hypothetical protein